MQKNAQGAYEPSPAPRLSRTPAHPIGAARTRPRRGGGSDSGSDSVEVLLECGLSMDDIKQLAADGAVAIANNNNNNNEEEVKVEEEKKKTKNLKSAL